MQCNGETEKEQVPAASKPSRYEKFLLAFPDLNADTLFVTSPREDTVASKEKWLHGTLLDSASIILLPGESGEVSELDGPSVFAIGRISLGDRYVGLLARTPSTYSPTSIKLFFLDKVTDSITSYVEVAEKFGDAGDAMDKYAWIFRDGPAALKAFIFIEEFHDNSVEDARDTTIDEWKYYYLLGFKDGRADTLSKDSASLSVLFANQLKALNGNTNFR